tara:strand:- start:2232 stop:2876 length:645 start_codon:yes stop_codon:yes gene_type:complete
MILKSLIKKPKSLNNKKNNDVIFLLHGYGSNELDLFSFKDFFSENQFIISLRAPIKLFDNGYAWFNLNIENNNIESILDDFQIHNSLNLLKRTIDYFVKKYYLKGNKTIIGFSQGAIISWSLIFDNYIIFNKIVSLSGFINFNYNINLTPEIKKIKCFVSHGINDPVIPIELSRKTKAFLKENNFNMECKEYDQGHNVGQQNLHDLINWLKKNN